MLGDVPDYESAETPVADEDVGAEPEDEIRQSGPSDRDDGRRQVVRGISFIIEVGRTSYFEGGVWS